MLAVLGPVLVGLAVLVVLVVLTRRYLVKVRQQVRQALLRAELAMLEGLGKGAGNFSCTYLGCARLERPCCPCQCIQMNELIKAHDQMSKGGLIGGARGRPSRAQFQ